MNKKNKDNKEKDWEKIMNLLNEHSCFIDDCGKITVGLCVKQGLPNRQIPRSANKWDIDYQKDKEKLAKKVKQFISEKLVEQRDEKFSDIDFKGTREVIIKKEREKFIKGLEGIVGEDITDEKFIELHDKFPSVSIQLQKGYNQAKAEIRKRISNLIKELKMRN